MSSLQPFNGGDSGRVVPVRQCESAIMDTYQQFRDGVPVSSAEFDRSCSALENLEGIETSFRNNHYGQNPVEHDRLCRLRERVEAMQGASQHLVRRDLTLFQSFLQRRDDTYFCAPNEELYLQPDDGGLVQLCSLHFSFELYDSFQFSRDVVLKDPLTGQIRPSTVLFFIKRRDQIRFENQDQSASVLSEVPFVGGCLELYRLHKQEKYYFRSSKQQVMLETISQEIQGSLKQRKYDSIAVLSTPESRRQFGFSKDNATETDAIVLSYKRFDESLSGSERVEEIFDTPQAASVAPSEPAKPSERILCPEKVHKDLQKNRSWLLIQRIKRVLLDLFQIVQRLWNRIGSRVSTNIVSTTA
jgi:hypothetical protein